MRAFTQRDIVTLSTAKLEAIVASTNPNGRYAQQLQWAECELDRRAEYEPAQDDTPSLDDSFHRYEMDV
jgi:hypothetical protein